MEDRRLDPNVERLYYDTFFCPMCVDLLITPVTLPCGHTFCMNCITSYWDYPEPIVTYICPQCKQTFPERPALVKNLKLAIVIRDPGNSGSGDVSCDLCTEKKVKAVKSCLRCLVSYCKEHLQPHYDVPVFQKHRLVEPLENVQENFCFRHDEVMKLFCRTDQRCICDLCSVDQHKDHDIVTAASERAEKQRGLQTQRQNVLQTIQLREKAVDEVQQQLKVSRCSADAAVKQSDQSLKELVHLLEKKVNKLKLQIRSQQEAEEIQVKELQDNMQQQITQFRRTLAELDTLSHTEDHVLFLHKFSSLSKVAETSDSVNISLAPHRFQDMVTAAVSELKSQLQPTALEQLHAARFPPQPSHPFNFDTSNLEDIELHDLLRYSRRLTFDPQSLNFRLSLSNGDTVVKRELHKQKYPAHPQRFLTVSQVVSRQVLRGRCFWQVLLKYEDGFGVAVSYPSINRDGASGDSRFGKGKSWLLECYKDHFELTIDKFVYHILIEGDEYFCSPSKIGIFVDHDAGILAFF